MRQPMTDNTQRAGQTDVRMMVVVHTAFRRELGLAVPAVRSVPPGDSRRAATIADHVTLFTEAVHHHHTIEDEMLWDQLTERLPAETQPIVALMVKQHEAVARMLTGCPPLVTTWRNGATTVDRDALADHLAELVAALTEHLDAEEAHVLPLMARYVTPTEWEAFTEAGMRSIPKRLMLVGFGMMAYQGDPEVMGIEVAKLPRPLRRVLPMLSGRAYARYAREIHGTATPATAS
jgi:hemerythrin-like domain-containing protein